MGEIKVIETRNNDMVSQIRKLIERAFPPIFEYKVEYYIGEEEDTQRVMLVFLITSKSLGDLYRKVARMDTKYAVDDIEPDFIGRILADFVMLGTTLITNNVMASRAAKQEDSDAILTHPFSKSRLNQINRN